MAISGPNAFHQYVAAKAAPTAQYFSNICNSATIIGAPSVFYSFWQFPVFPGPGVVPPTGGGAACDRTTQGAFPFTLPGGSNSLYLDHVSGIAGATLDIFMADRLVHTSGLDGTNTGVQAVNTVALPARAASGVGVQAMLEPYTNTGGVNVTFTMNYTNTANAAKVATTSGIMNGTGKALIFPLAAGDLGVKSVQSIQSPTTGAAGNYGVTLFRPIAPFTGGTGPSVSPNASTLDTSVMLVDPDTCLWAYAMASAAISLFQHNVLLIEG
jgi:hypothetical protein